MKSIPLRTLPHVKADLFDTAGSQSPQTSLQLHRGELVELLSQLLWQVARHPDSNQQLENDDEQDQS